MPHFFFTSVEFFKARIFLILWISLVVLAFYETFSRYATERKFYQIRKILGLGLCISRGTASVINICSSLVLFPLCKKLNQVLYWLLSKLWPGLFFFWLEKAKSFHMTVAITLVLFSVIHSVSHMVNMWNFSRGYDEQTKEINFANHKNQNPIALLFSQAGITGVAMLAIIISMGLTSLRIVRRKKYNAFWYTHKLYIPFLVMLIIHPLSGVLKEEVLEKTESSLHLSQAENTHNMTINSKPRFIPIKSQNWLWMIIPLCCYFVDTIWRIFTRNCSEVHITQATHMTGRTISLTMRSPHDQFNCRMGQYVLLQCRDASLLEWHPFTITKIPTSTYAEFSVWIRVKGDWTETVEKLLIERGPSQLSMLVDGPFSSPMESAMHDQVAICVAAGVGITPFVSLMHHMLESPRSRLPGRIHLLWIVRNDAEVTWLADLATNLIITLRNSNRPDRFHLELFITRTKTKETESDLKNLIVTLNKKGLTKHLSYDRNNEIDNEKAILLTPNINRNTNRKGESEVHENNYDICKQYPIIGCRVKRGRPHWNSVFGNWVHLYPDSSLNLYCCGPKKLVHLLSVKCKQTSKETRTKLTLIHEAFG